MWKKYAVKYDLKVDIMSMSKPIDVDNARYYRLIIIDRREPQSAKRQQRQALRPTSSS
jgi:hypothetical protein